MRPRRLRGRLLVANLLVAAVALGTVLVGVSLIGPGYFETAMGHPPGDPQGSAMDAATLAAFQSAVRTALLAATLSALVAAVIVSLATSARVAGPVSRLASAARRIAAGHYAERVPVEDPGEVGELAEAFNAMSGSLEETERRRLELVGDVAHELRTPLTTLDGYLEGLQDGVIEPGVATWGLLRGETQRLTRLVGDLGELWRAEARQLPLHPELVDVRAILTELTLRYAPLAAEREMTVALGEAEGNAMADPDRVAQIVGNYLSNALRYAPSGSTVRLSAQRVDGSVAVAVADEGPGLTAEQLAHVFERFYRPDPSRSRALGGSGIGLAIARALAEAMGGRAWAESGGPGSGSTFFLALPSA
ncbi:MAG TPA: ATP-binding protein [Candidatus Limnocylindria bacterium]